MTAVAAQLDRLLSASPYQGYLYAYPHKTAYRPFAEPVALTDLWRAEDRRRRSRRRNAAPP